VSFTFVTKTGEKMKVVGKEGWSLLDTARATDVDLEGACEASVACSTCHVIFDDDTFDLLEDTGREATEDEDDMLDMAVGLTMT
jgi:ferredoxin